MPKFGVTIPIGGHAYIEVEADSPEDAIEKAAEGVLLEHIQEWDVIHEVNSGNVCNFPEPWESSAELITEG